MVQGGIGCCWRQSRRQRKHLTSLPPLLTVLDSCTLAAFWGALPCPMQVHMQAPARAKRRTTTRLRYGSPRGGLQTCPHMQRGQGPDLKLHRQMHQMPCNASSVGATLCTAKPAPHSRHGGHGRLDLRHLAAAQADADADAADSQDTVALVVVGLAAQRPDEGAGLKRRPLLQVLYMQPRARARARGQGGQGRRARARQLLWVSRSGGAARAAATKKGQAG